ncbi:hypothetical protein M2R47_08715 [Moraxella sp. Tifton1]|uniref:hypothetical protein n=1 Tax=Moraxella oculi TaxID=2940516 RepID=UPI0020127138|nr:hypothetical protein [Moraxella sp. Tifton1]MCL1624315.1 hypothetical protein [Moraxella sp. Tifton1]
MNNIITEQAKERDKHLPKGMVQKIYIDLRGQAYTDQDLLDIKTRIVNKSNGFIKLENIKFIEDNK